MSKYEIINTGICDLCGSKMNTVKGSETPTMLECPKCGQYAYEIFGVLCIKEAVLEPSHFKYQSQNHTLKKKGIR